MSSAFNSVFAPQTKDREEWDFYPTVPWATEALLQKEDFWGPIWEPTCGLGSMAEPLRQTGEVVFSSDTKDYGYPLMDARMDFLRDNQMKGVFRHIVTNPPYKEAKKFIEQGLDLIQEGGTVCMLLRLMFLEGITRKEFLERHLARVHVFSMRVPFLKGELPTKENPGAKMVPFAWFVFEKNPTAPAMVEWI